MNIAKSFANYLDDTGVATLGQNLFIGEAPSSKESPDSLFWIMSTGGSKTIKLQTGESVKVYNISLFYRNRNYQMVYDTLFDLEEQLNCTRCSLLDEFDTIDIGASVLSVDSDLDGEDRKVGVLQVIIRTYKECVV